VRKTGETSPWRAKDFYLPASSATRINSGTGEVRVLFLTEFVGHPAGR
jgi:hypothetical protein